MPTPDGEPSAEPGEPAELLRAAAVQTVFATAALALAAVPGGEGREARGRVLRRMQDRVAGGEYPEWGRFAACAELTWRCVDRSCRSAE